MRIYGDLWWPAALLLFGPRWVLLLPLLLLIPVAARYNIRLLPSLLVASLALVWLFLGFNLPFQKLSGAKTTGKEQALRVLTCNVRAEKHDSKRLVAFIHESKADIVALQECPVKFKLPLGEGWQMVQSGRLAIASRYPIIPAAPVRALHPPLVWPRYSLLSCTVSLPAKQLTFCMVHLPTPRNGLQNLLDRKTGISLARSGILVRETEHRLKTALDVQRSIASLASPAVIAGDFNTPVESGIYRKVWSGYSNAFSDAGVGFGWTNRARIKGLSLPIRIDHILTSGDMVTRSCEVGSDVGSDHLPLLAEIRL